MKITKLYAASLFVASVALFLSCNTDTKGTEATADSTTEATIDYSGKIAYLRMDSLMRGYGMYIDLSDEFTKKGQQVEAELTQKGRALEREAASYQEKAQKGLITRFEGQTIEADLQKKNQAVMQYRDEMMREMQQQEAVITAQISDEIMTYLKEYNQDKKFSLILQTTAGNPVILADPALDITGDVLAELNKRYLANKGTANKVTPAAKTEKK